MDQETLEQCTEDGRAADVLVTGGERIEANQQQFVARVSQIDLLQVLERSQEQPAPISRSKRQRHLRDDQAFPW